MTIFLLLADCTICKNHDSQANEQYELLIWQMAKTEGVTEQMKAENQMEWVERITNIRNSTEERANQELREF